MDDIARALTCQQAVSAADDCCHEEVCEAPAAWLHVTSGAALCAEHEANARKWSSGGTWRVGNREVSYPNGWERIVGGGTAESTLIHVDTSAALVVEREPLPH